MLFIQRFFIILNELFEKYEYKNIDLISLSHLSPFMFDELYCDFVL